MKKFLSLIAVALAFFANSASAQKLTVNNIEMAPGGDGELVIGIDYTEPVSALFINTCEASTLTSNSSDESFERQKSFFEFGDVIGNYGITVTKRESGTISDFYKNGSNTVANKNIICILGHGMILKDYGDTLSYDEPIICFSNQTYNYNTYKDLIDTEAIIRHSIMLDTLTGDDSYYNKTVDGYLARPKFFKYYMGNIQDSFVCLLVCFSCGKENSLNTKLADAFCESGANSVTCYRNSVNTAHAIEQLEIYLAGLIAGGSSLEAYQVAKEVCGYTHSAWNGVTSYYQIVAREKVPDSSLSSFVNGDFEASFNTVPGWKTTGDVKIKPKLGSTKANGKYMAFISTGVGATSGVELTGTGGQQGSSMSQTVQCNKNNNKLIFTYDVYSEEPMEYVGSMFDDKFLVQIKELETGVKYEVVVESVNNSEWYSVTGVNFDGGDLTTYHTGKKVCTIGIPEELYGKSIEVSFLVCDVGDSAFDTAVVIDDVKLGN